MNLIRLSISRPIAVLAAVMMVVLFGWVALQRIPIQLAPDVRRPVIIVRTSWPGASPVEIEREIMYRQEEVLKGLEGLQEMSGTARHGSSSITLEFPPGYSLDRAMMLVANRLDRVSGYPAEADEPRLRTSGTEDNAIAWFAITRVEGNDRPMVTYGDFLQDVVQDRIERVPGVSGVNIFGDTEREMRIIVDPVKLARYALTVGEVMDRLRGQNASNTGGGVIEGKRRYIVRTEGDISTVEQVKAIVLRSTTNGDVGRVGRVTLGDIADITLDYKELRAVIREMGEPSMGFNVAREQGANVIEVMAGIQATIKELAEGPLKEAGLQVKQIYDETEYINSAIGLVQQNIVVGGLLAAIVLLLFLRSMRATMIVGLAIPVSVIGTFIAMAALGRSLNVISLAGIAFAVGMVVDAAIVVLENIYRLRQEGVPPAEAAYRGTAQVWGAVLVSALTTVMVFIPILVMELEVGQLFRDIAVAISVSVILSLIVSITLIPALSNRMLRGDIGQAGSSLRIPGIDHFARGFVRFWQAFARTVVHRKSLALLVVGAIVAGAAVFTVEALPKLDYLPTGNRNFVFGFIQPPDGYNLETVAAATNQIEKSMRQHWAEEGAPAAGPDDTPKMKRYFAVALEGRAFIAASAVDPSRSGELIALMSGPARSQPGINAAMYQPSLFGRSVGGGRAINIDIAGPDLPTLFIVGQEVQQRVQQAMPPADGHQVRALPGLSMGAPELRLVPDPVRLADNGLSVRELGQVVDVFNDGVRVAEITVDGRRIDLTIAGPRREISETQGIGSLPVVTRQGRIVPVESLANITLTAGPTQIRRKERARTITLRVTPAKAMPLEEAMDIIDEQVLAPVKAAGLPAGVTFRISGTADNLTKTWDEMVWNLLLAAVIVYLVMAILFESFLYPLIIMSSVPVAAAGGLGGLSLLNLYVNQPLDMLTMLGFVILVGIVVNNAILLVHQTLFLIREEGMAAAEAIARATQNRVRPIFMSTLTSVFGMLPLVLFPGAGSELYRGLGSVVLGGLSLSAVLTLAIVPPMMAISVAVREKRRERQAIPIESARQAAE